MKKYGLRVLVGLITFTIGVFGVWLLINKVKFNNYCNQKSIYSKVEIEKYRTSPNGKVEIRFQGYGKMENRPTLKFEIINHNSNSAKYRSFAEKSIWTFVKFNDKQKEEWRCGTGMREFTLKSGDSFVIEFQADSQIFEFLRKERKFQFGYYFDLNEKNGDMIWSEQIVISEELKRDIIKNAPDFLRQH